MSTQQRPVCELSSFMHVCPLCASMEGSSGLAALAECFLPPPTTLATCSLLPAVWILHCLSAPACRLGEGELSLRVRMAFGMFDTRGR